LKPENVLFNKDGYILLADFGLATKVDEKKKLAWSFCGTPEYLAPEMLTGEGHDHTVDWWTLGILLYEMLVGIPPFFDRNRNQMYRSIRNANVTYPIKERHNIEVLPVAQDFINKLLIKKKDVRLGRNGLKEILGHPFFAGLDIDSLMNKSIVPLYNPEIKDCEYFDQKLVQLDDDQITFTEITGDKKRLIDKN